jgi:anti-sigma regulatory factor (Ser/Thr protein kinase)
MTTTTFKASISPRFLGKVDRVFDASPTTVFNELLQNARRAGAKEVVVTLEAFEDNNSVRVKFADDGIGMEDPAALLCLADKGWDDETENREDPAGMGFFCLSNFREVHIASRDWQGVITPAVFRGEEDMHVSAAPTVEGSCIQWEWEGYREYTLESDLSGAAQYCGLESVVIVSGSGDRQTRQVIKPVGFLDECVERRFLPNLGAEIGVLNSSSFAAYLNFYGVNIWLSTSSDNNWDALRSLNATIRVDVTRCSDLQLVLPARNAVKHNAGRDELLLECERTLYSWLVNSKQKHNLPFRVYNRAKEVFGIDIGEARNNLHFAANYTDGSVVLVADNVRHILGFKHLIELAAYSDAAPRCQDQEKSGYSWYDALPIIEDVIVTINGEEKQDVFEDQYHANSYNNGNSGSSNLFEWVSSIKVDFKLSNGDVYTVEPVTLVSGESAVSEFDELHYSHKVYVNEAAKENAKMRADVVDSLYSSAFQAAEGYDVDISEENQGFQFETEARAALLEFIGDDQASAKCHLEGALSQSKLKHALESDWVWSLHSALVPDRSNLLIMGPHLKTDVADCRKFVTTTAGNKATCELVSQTAVTSERIEAYMKAARGYDNLDGELIVSDYALPVDLDAWEAGQ